MDQSRQFHYILYNHVELRLMDQKHKYDSLHSVKIKNDVNDYQMHDKFEKAVEFSISIILRFIIVWKPDLKKIKN